MRYMRLVRCSWRWRQGWALTSGGCPDRQKIQLQEELEKLRKAGDVEWSDCHEKVRLPAFYSSVCEWFLPSTACVVLLSRECGVSTVYRVCGSTVSHVCVWCFYFLPCVWFYCLAFYCLASVVFLPSTVCVILLSRVCMWCFYRLLFPSPTQ